MGSTFRQGAIRVLGGTLSAATILEPKCLAGIKGRVKGSDQSGGTSMNAMRVMRWQRVDSLTKQLARSLGLHYEAHTYKEYQKYVVRQTTVKPRHEIN